MRNYQGSWRHRHPVLIVIVEFVMVAGTLLLVSAPDWAKPAADYAFQLIRSF